MNDNLILGITRINDLFLEKTISEIIKNDQHEAESLTDVNLIIPDYQRPYKWTAKNISQLLDDIEEAFTHNKEIFRVGTIILHEETNEEKGHIYNIVDGQQRLISFSLLLRCFNSTTTYFLDNKVCGNEYNLLNIKNNYLTLHRRLSRYSDELKEKLKKYVLNNCQFIVVITNNISEAFQFFDSQNARGKKLYPHDLLKAYHLREMNSLNVEETVNIVKSWEDLDQTELAKLFNEYLYRLKEWIKGNVSYELNEKNLDLFKGITAKDNYPYAQFYKGAFSYLDAMNKSPFGFVVGLQEVNPFQLNSPIIAGKPFFEYAGHYYQILADIKNNDKYDGYFINDNEIVKTLDAHFSQGTGNRIVRMMFDVAILLFVDRFCPQVPSKSDLEYLEQFVIYAFVWAYSLRAQYINIGRKVAENYIQGNVKKDNVKNGFNIYKVISEADSPTSLLSSLADKLQPISNIDKALNKELTKDIEKADNSIFCNYLHFFKVNGFYEEVR